MLQSAQQASQVECNAQLGAVFQAKQVKLSSLSHRINPHLRPIEPLSLRYTVRLGVPCSSSFPVAAFAYCLCSETWSKGHDRPNNPFVRMMNDECIGLSAWLASSVRDDVCLRGQGGSAGMLSVCCLGLSAHTLNCTAPELLTTEWDHRRLPVTASVAEYKLRIALGSASDTNAGAYCCWSAGRSSCHSCLHVWQCVRTCTASYACLTWHRLSFTASSWAFTHAAPLPAHCRHGT